MLNVRSDIFRKSYTGFLVLFLGISATGRMAMASPDITKVLGPNECAECHEKEVDAWRETRHYKTFRELAKTTKAKKIGKALGIRRFKKDSACVVCHFTQQMNGGKTKTIAGIGCESCHGASKDWIDIHNDYGGKNVKKDQETPDHKKMRIGKAIKAGMIAPSDIYSVANNCYGCHLVPNERLVNKGEHQAGSKFELVRWSQGEVRHNYYSSTTGNENASASPERLRMMYVIGNALELEHALRAISKATQKARYAVKMAKRVKLATRRLKKISGLINNPELKSIIKIGASAKLKLNNETELNAAAEGVADLAKKLTSEYDGSEFSALDSLIPDSSKYKGKASE